MAELNIFLDWIKEKNFDIDESNLKDYFQKVSNNNNLSVIEKSAKISAYLDDNWGLYEYYDEINSYLQDIFSNTINESKRVKKYYKVVTKDLKSLGLRKNPTIMRFPMYRWKYEPRPSWDEGGWGGTGGIWVANGLSGGKGLMKYMYNKYPELECRLFEVEIGNILFSNSYRTKTDKVKLVKEIEWTPPVKKEEVLNESLPHQKTIDQLKMVRKLSKNTDIGDRIPDLKKQGANLHYYRNPIDSGIESYEDFEKHNKKFVPSWNLKHLLSPFKNEK